VPFVKGKSGNPAGRPIGARHKTLVALESLFDNEGEALSRKCVAMAMDGDGVAMRLALERILPPRRDRPISFRLPPLEKPEDALAAVSAIVDGVASGEITASEAGELSKLIDAFARTIETVSYGDRIAALEAGKAGP
jgi:Family of unknown function (DUF5681)